MDWTRNSGAKPDYVGPIEIRHPNGQIKRHPSVDTVRSWELSTPPSASQVIEWRPAT